MNVMRSRRWSVARARGIRGAGLGNEIFALSKAAIAAQALDADLVEQPWWLNRRHYGKEIGYNIVPPLSARLASVTRARLIDIDDKTLADPWDYRKSMENLRRSLPAAFVLRHNWNMECGYLGIKPARDFLKRRLGIREVTPQMAHLRVGLHVRMGDFAPADVIQPGVFNRRLPLAWVKNAVESVRRSTDLTVEVRLFSDAKPTDPELSSLLDWLARRCEVGVERGTVLGDLNGLIDNDLIIGSVSSYTMLALFLSQTPYILPAEALTPLNGYLSLWGFRSDVRHGPTARFVDRVRNDQGDCIPRGLPLASHYDEDISAWLSQVTGGSRLPFKEESDLLYFGVVPVPIAGL